MTCFLELMYAGRIISHTWRIYFDKKLSTVLTKLERIHEKLICLNVVRPMKIKMNMYFIIGIIIHFVAHNIFLINWFIDSFRDKHAFIIMVIVNY